jgi:hypothetical protein
MLRRAASRGLGKKPRERRLQLGLGIDLAIRRVEEARAVDQAGLAGAEQIGAIVTEIEPLTACRQVLGAGARDQLVQIVSRTRRGLRADQRPACDQGRDDASRIRPPPSVGGRRNLR